MMSFKTTRENFGLVKLKVTEGGGLTIDSKITVNIDGSTQEIDRNDKMPIVPHPDLVNAVEVLKPKLLKSIGFLMIKTIINSEEFKATKAQKEAGDKHMDLIMERTTVNGVRISGEDETAGVIIMGKIRAENGSYVAINSPRMRFSSEVYGFEEELEEDARTIETEAFLYLHEGKKAQMEMFDDNE